MFDILIIYVYIFNMSKIYSNLQCPSCSDTLLPRVLECAHCDIKVEGPFHLNEFATLSSEDLHFLRIFVRCEGRVRDMEPALGLSYPTIRARLSNLKTKLMESAEIQSQETSSKPESTQEILKQLELGRISFEDAMDRIKQKERS